MIHLTNLGNLSWLYLLEGLNNVRLTILIILHFLIYNLSWFAIWTNIEVVAVLCLRLELWICGSLSLKFRLRWISSMLS